MIMVSVPSWKNKLKLELDLGCVDTQAYIIFWVNYYVVFCDTTKVIKKPAILANVIDRKSFQKLVEKRTLI